MNFSKKLFRESMKEFDRRRKQNEILKETIAVAEVERREGEDRKRKSHYCTLYKTRVST